MNKTWKNPLLEATASPHSLRFLAPKVGSSAASPSPTPAHKDRGCQRCGFVRCACQPDWTKVIEAAVKCRLLPLPIATMEELKPSERSWFCHEPQLPVTVMALLIGATAQNPTGPTDLVLRAMTCGVTSMLPSRLASMHQRHIADSHAL